MPSEDKSETKYSFDQTHEAPGYTFAVRANNGESTTIYLETQGLDVDFQESFTTEGQIKESLMLDINNDGRKEFYLLISPTDDSGNIYLKAFVANGTNSITEATVMDDKLGPREMNSDQVSADSGTLVRKFKVDGKEVEFNYMLMDSGAGSLIIPTLVQK